MAVLADGRARADGRAEPSLRATTRRRRSPTRSSATSRRPIGCTACSTGASPTASSSPATTRSPTWRAIRGSCRTSGRARTSTTSRNLKRWFEAIKARPATVRAYELAKEINTAPSIDRGVAQDPVRPDRGGGALSAFWGFASAMTELVLLQRGAIDLQPTGAFVLNAKGLPFEERSSTCWPAIS